MWRSCRRPSDRSTLSSTPTGPPCYAPSEDRPLAPDGVREPGGNLHGHRGGRRSRAGSRTRPFRARSTSTSTLQCPKEHPNCHLDVRWLAVAGGSHPADDESPTSAGSRSTPRRLTPTSTAPAGPAGAGEAIDRRPSPDVASGPPPLPLERPPDRTAHNAPWRVSSHLARAAVWPCRGRRRPRTREPAVRYARRRDLEDFCSRATRSSTGSPTTSRGSSGSPSPP
jgi:hypothetical protein